MRDTGRLRLVYILAASHSGSTLLTMLLGAHPEICTVGELKATSLGDKENYLCSCRKKINECHFWKGISLGMAERGFTFEITNAGTDFNTGASTYARRLLAPLHRGPLLEKIRDIALNLSSAWRSNLPTIQDVNANLIQCILERTGKRVIVDSSKVGIRLKYLLRNPMLDVSIIRLIRDGREVALTYMKPEFADATDPCFRGAREGKCLEIGRSMKKAAKEWRRSNEEADAILKHADRLQWIQVSYEALCTKTTETLSRIFTFIGVDPDKFVPAFKSLEHHVIGNSMRFDTDSEIRLDERWKTTLDISEVEIFESEAGELNRRLGYN